MEQNETIEKMLNEHPLVSFSVYTSIQTGILRELGRQIVEELDGSIEDGTADSNGITRAYGLFWLWVLGSFEVLRNMCNAESCFALEVSDRLKAFKRKLVNMRMPFAKQEYPGRRAPIKGEASIYGINTSTKDLKFEVEGTIYTVRGLINEFDELISGIGRADILARHESIYPDSTR